MELLNERTYEQLYNDHENYNHDRNKFIKELNKITFIDGDNLIIHKSIYDKYLNINLINHFGFSVSSYDNENLLISEINTTSKIKNILESTKMNNQVLLITFDLIERYMTIIAFISYIKKYNKQWLDMCVSYEKKLLKINIV